MALKNFIKENFVLAVGLALPVLLVFAFLAMSTLPRMFSTPPEYKLLLADRNNYYTRDSQADYSMEFVVQNGTLHMRLKPTKKDQYVYTQRLMIYDLQNDSVKKVDIVLPPAGKYTQTTILPVEAAAGFKIDTNSKAPDGYSFEQSRGRSGGLVTDVFGGGYRNRSQYVKKGMSSYRLPQVDGSYYYYDNDAFIGWVVEEK